MAMAGRAGSGWAGGEHRPCVTMCPFPGTLGKGLVPPSLLREFPSPSLPAAWGNASVPPEVSRELKPI